MQTDTFMRLFMDVCPHRVGKRVKVSPKYQYAAEWPGTYIVVAIRWAYQNSDGHEIEIDIASEEEIIKRHGSTGPWKADDLLPA